MKPKPEKKSIASLTEADARFIPVANAFARTRGFSLMESRTGAMRGLTLNGKSFGMSLNGRFVLNLNQERAATLIGEGIGIPFRPSADRVMKGWIEVTHSDADWVALAREAYLLATVNKTTTKRSKR